MRDLSTRAERHLGTYTYNKVWMSDGYKLVETDFHADTVLDIGANVGLFVLAARRRWPNCRIVAVEPCEATFGELQATVGDMAGVHCVQAALGPRGAAVWTTNAPHGGVAKYRSEAPDPGWQPATVQSTPLGDYGVTPENSGELAVKVDCEGAELCLLNDPEARALVEHARWVAMELHYFEATREQQAEARSRLVSWAASFGPTHSVTMHLHHAGGRLWMRKR